MGQINNQLPAKVVLVHTVPPLIDVFTRLGAELLPGIQLQHILDETLLERVRQRGHLVPEDSNRLGEHVTAAEEIHADAVLVTCSTVSPCVDDIRTAAIPVKKIDEAMIAEAVHLGSRIGVVATAETTLEPTRILLREQAEQQDSQIETELVLVEDALAALLSGDGGTHDRLVKAATLNLAERVDVVLLAQASMARVLATISKSECNVPVLSSPHLALKQIQGLLAS